MDAYFEPFEISVSYPYIEKDVYYIQILDLRAYKGFFDAIFVPWRVNNLEV